jgi:hypothetical protein
MTYTVLLLFILSSESTLTQLNPTNNNAFLQNEVAKIKIYIVQTDLDYILNEDNLFSDQEFPATFIYNSNASNDTILNIGFRLRGNTSRYAKKKSFSISFNEFVSGQKFKGLKKMNLNGQHNDVSLMRTKLSQEILNNVGLHSSRTSYVELYINDEYKGLYVNVEHIDKEFLESRFTTDFSGNLYKCNYGADLTYWGSNPENYYSTFELKTNKTQNNYSGLIHFLEILNSTPNSTFACEIEKVLDVESYLKSAAFEILIGHWDGYIYNKNNFYLYQRPSDMRFVYLCYDMDNTFGVDWFNIDWSIRNIYNWQSNETRPLFNKLMEIPFYKQLFTEKLKEMLDSTFKSDILATRINEIQNLIASSVELDSYRTLDYGFSYQDFLNSNNLAWGSHIKQSLNGYISSRITSVQGQLINENHNHPCVASIEENKKESSSKLLFITNILGQKISTTSPNEMILFHYENGKIEKKINIK